MGVGEGNKLRFLKQLQFPHSLGLLYSAFTYYCGFKVNSGEYKLMGLAPYGQPRYRDAILQKLIDLKPDGSFWMNMEYFDYCQGLTMTSPRFHDLFGGPPRSPESLLEQRHMDLAASIQKVTEEIILRIGRETHRETGMKNLVLAGGVDALSRAPLLYSDPMVRWFAGWMGARSLGEKLAMIRRFKLGYLAPVIGIMKGLTDPIVGQLMGQTAENLAFEFGITRDDMDAFAVESHRRVAAAQDAGHFGEIVPLIDKDGTVYGADDGLLRDAAMAGLAKLKPFFDKKYGRVTPANSSQITDGAAWLILASEDAVQRHGLER